MDDPQPTYAAENLQQNPTGATAQKLLSRVRSAMEAQAGDVTGI